MALTDKQKELIEILYGKRTAVIENEYSEQFRIAEYLDPDGIPHHFASLTKQLASERVSARIDAYTESVDKLKIVPSSDDFQIIATDLKELAHDSMRMFRLKMKPPKIKAANLEDMTELLQSEIDRIVGEAVPRLRYFIDEHVLLDSIKKPITNLTQAETAEFKSEWIDRRQNLALEFQRWLDSFEAKPYGVFAEKLKNHAFETIHARVETYKEICDEYRKYPNEADLISFTNEARAELDGVYARLDTFLANPLGQYSTSEIDDARKVAMRSEFDTILSTGIRPLRTFQLKGKAMQENNEARPAIAEKGMQVNIQKYIAGNENNLGDVSGGNQNFVSVASDAEFNQINNLETKKKSWSLEAKIAFVALIVTIIAAIIATLVTIFLPSIQTWLCTIEITSCTK